MCGICGIIDSAAADVVSKERIARMRAALVHRGPDDEGVYLSRSSSGISVGLGHRRLKIIDLSQAGHQPMSNEDGSIWIVFNGEVYNFVSLRKDLEDKGHRFKSRTDTEVVIHLYEEYGRACVKCLRGMFAFAIWDSREEIVFAARDRLGQKPLFCYSSGNRFCFASELSSLLAGGLVDKKVNLPALDYYLSLGYIPAPLTIYKDVSKLPPGHYLIWRRGHLEIERYWQLDYLPKLNIDEQEAQEEIIRLLAEAVKLRMISDVPLGAFLSGGIDSSCVVGLMAQGSRRVKTFSIGFQEDDFNELGYARIVARRFDTEHNEFTVKPEALKILPLLVERYGEPYADSSAVPTFYVSQQTKRFVTVALNGDGGDELFAGYDRYPAMIAAERLHNFPGLFKMAIKPLTAMLPDSVNPKSKLRRAKRFLSCAYLPWAERYLRWVGIFSDDLKGRIYGDGLSKIAGNNKLGILRELLGYNSGLSDTDRLLRADTLSYLPGDLLVKVDIATMSNSLEARSPFLDHKLVEFVACLPQGYKLKASSLMTKSKIFDKKYILKKSLKRLLPNEILSRKKMGFGVPVGKWFRGELKGFLQDALLCRSSLSRGYFNPDAVKDMVREHICGRKDWSFQLWALLMLELWHKRFMD